MTDSIKVYLSYSRITPYMDIIESLFIKLQELSIDVFFPKEMVTSGTDREMTKLNAIKSSDIVLICLDETTGASLDVQREIAMARAAEIAFLPIKLLEQSDVYNISEVTRQLYIENIQWDIYDPHLGYKRIITSVENLAEVTRKHKQSNAFEQFKPLFGKPSANPQFVCDIFMVMPFAERFQPIYDDHIIPVVHAQNLNIKRGDDFFASHGIMTDIWSALYASRLIIGDCTGQNANVFYELGIAHTIGRPTILITQDMDDIPFDLRHLRIIPYDYTPPGMKKFEKKLVDAIDKLLLVE